MRSPMVATVLSSKIYLEYCQHLREQAKLLRQADRTHNTSSVPGEAVTKDVTYMPRRWISSTALRQVVMLPK